LKNRAGAGNGGFPFQRRIQKECILNHIRNRQAGFTLVELIIVIIILGILAATAIPRFAQMQTEARISKLNALRGSVQEAATMVYGLTQTQSLPVTATTVTLQGQSIDIAFYYPKATAAGIMAAIGSYGTAGNMAADGVAVAAGAVAGLDIRVTGGQDPTACFFNYAEAPDATHPATVGTTTVSGC
jgi:MSHA pilin protein MshA